MIDVDALIVFSTVIAEGSFSAAAARLKQTPSGVSRTISRLEKQMGMTLMHRTTRRLDLTEEGAWLLQRARATLADLADTEEQARARRSQPSGLVRVNGDTTGVDPHAPFGDMKGSSSGSREQGSAARDFYTETKTVQVNP